MATRCVRVFHISDLHMRSVDGPQAERARLEAASRWRVLGAKWAANLAAIRKDGTAAELVVFTGDLGDWGHATDYPRALAFLKETCEALDVPLERLFVVPGNHDIDRSIHHATWESLRRDVARDPRTYSTWMAGTDWGALRDDDRRDLILERQKAFRTAVATELGWSELGPKHLPHRRLGYRQEVALPGLSQPIHVIGLDTAWLAGDEGDSGQLRLTEHQVSMLTTTEGGEPLPGFRLALMHHRLADLADGPDARKLMIDRVDLLVHGHQHEPAADVLQGPDHQLLVLATGCLYEGDEGHHYPNACQVIDLELDDSARPRSAKVRFRGWSERGMFWGDDALLYESAQSGLLRLQRNARGWHFANDGDDPHDAAQPASHHGIPRAGDGGSDGLGGEGGDPGTAGGGGGGGFLDNVGGVGGAAGIHGGGGGGGGGGTLLQPGTGGKGGRGFGAGGGGGGGGQPPLAAFMTAEQATGIPAERWMQLAGMQPGDPRLLRGGRGGHGGRGGGPYGAEGGEGGGAKEGSDEGEQTIYADARGQLSNAELEAAFGDGRDGVAVFDGIQVPAGATMLTPTLYKLTRHVQYTNMYISHGVTVRPGSHTVRVSGTLRIDGGAIRADGEDGTPGA